MFEGRGALPGTVPLHTLGSTSQQEPYNTDVPFGAGRLVWTYTWAFLGRPGGSRGWHPVQYLCKTCKALHEGHVWKTLTVRVHCACLRRRHVIPRIGSIQRICYLSSMFCPRGCLTSYHCDRNSYQIHSETSFPAMKSVGEHQSIAQKDVRAIDT